MDPQRTRAWYAERAAAHLCDCANCRRYYAGARKALPALAAWLDARGAAIEKPLEVLPVGEEEQENELENGVMPYSGVQYVLLGDAADFAPAQLGEISLIIAPGHPMTGLTEPHFVVEAGPIVLPVEPA